MLAVTFTGAGGNEVVRLAERPDPVPGTEDVLVRVRFAGLNPADLLQRAGRYPPPSGSSPDVPGLEVAGVVETCGERVTAWRPGDRVFGLVGGGGLAARVIVHERCVARVPDVLDEREAAAVPEAFITAHDAIRTQAGLAPGETLLVHGAAGGVGSAAVQVAKLFGARVIATTSTDAKAAELRKIGADEVIIYAKQSVQEEVRRLTGKRGVDVVIDHVGAAVWTDSIRSLTKGGRLVICGATSGYEATTDLRYVFYKQIQILGSTMGRKGDLMTILKLMEQGSLRPVIHAVLPMSEVREGHRIVEAGEHIGKIVLTV